MSEITPEGVVADLFAAEGTDYDDSGNGWSHEVKANDNVIEITITPSDEDGVETDETFHFRAVVVAGDETPVVLEWPTELGLSWDDGGDLLTFNHGIIRFNPRGVDEWDLSPAEALELAGQLAAMASLGIRKDGAA